MTPDKLKQLIEDGESISVEFKSCHRKLTKDIYITICAFLNRHGGHIILGVSDDGEICGIDENYVSQIRKDFVTNINNSQKINPPIYLLLNTIKIRGKLILHAYIPPSSSVHTTNGKIYDRNEDGDFNITNNTLLTAKMYLRKQQSYSENTVYPYVTFDDLRPELIQKSRRLATNRRRNHPWSSMTDLELINSAQLYQQDHQTGKKGFTLAAVLLLGNDEVIRSIVPHYKTDCIKRIFNVDRYDDREIVITNLIESYEIIMDFIQKHLPDPFYLEGTERISLRDKVFREIVSNMLIHREFMNGSVARLIIEAEKIIATNANRPHGFGPVELQNYEPFPKNPNIAAFFREIGRAEELGSGVKNLFKYCKTYTGSDPILLEQDTFKIELAQPLGSHSGTQATTQATTQVDKASIILDFCRTPRSRKEIMDKLKLKNTKHFRESILRPLLAEGKLALTKPDVPNSPNQKYKSNKNL